METLTLAPPAAPPTDRSRSPSALGLVELMLKDPAQLQDQLRDESLQPTLIPRFLAIALTGFSIFGIAATVVLNAAGLWPAWIPAARWLETSALNLIFAYDLGLVAATGICLPSFYFYGLLAGLKISMLEVTAHAAKCLATTAVVLIGILPIYVALALGMIVFGAPAEMLHYTLLIALGLPFIAGLWGVHSLYLGFVRLAETLPPERRTERGQFLRRLTLAWATCYTFVTPVMIASLWRHFSG